MKKHHILSALLASFLIILSFHGVHAQDNSVSISGDELCGATASTTCNLTHIKVIAQKMLYAFVLIGGSLLVLFIMIRLVQSWFAYREGNAGAIKKAGENIFQGIIGFFIVFSVLGGLLIAGLSYLGTKPEFLKFLQLLSDAFIPHAYAASSSTGDRLLPNPLGSNNLFDLILAGMNLAMRFFVYPALIVMWVWSGFQFVYSQGNPEGLKKARSWLLWAFLISVIAFSLQGFLLALKSTALKIAPQNAGLIQPSQSSQGDNSAGGGSATAKPNGSSCTTGTDCSSGFCDTTDDTCTIAGGGNKKPNNYYCTSSTECSSNYCDLADNSCSDKP